MKALKITLFLAAGLIGWQAIPASAMIMPYQPPPPWHIKWDKDLDHETQWNHGDHQVCLAELSKKVLIGWPISGGIRPTSLVRADRQMLPVPFASRNLPRPDIQERYDLRLTFTDGAYKVSLRANCSYGVLTARYQIRNLDSLGEISILGYSPFRNQRETSMEILDTWTEHSVRGEPLIRFVLDNLTQQEQITLLEQTVDTWVYPEFLLHLDTMKNGLDINLSLREDPVSHKGF